MTRAIAQHLALLQRANPSNRWEVGILKKMARRLIDGVPLSPRQLAALREIVTSAEEEEAHHA